MKVLLFLLTLPLLAEEKPIDPNVRAAIFETLAQIRGAEAAMIRAEAAQKEAVAAMQKQLVDCGCELREVNGKLVLSVKPPEPKKEAKK